MAPLKPDFIAQALCEEAIKKCMSSEKKSRRSGLGLLAKEPLVKSMLPKLAKFIKQETQITVVGPDFEKLGMLLCMIKSLLSNTHVSLEKELGQLLPGVVTCLVISKLSEASGHEDPWMLRRYAANLLGEMVRSYNNEENKIQKRVEKVLIGAIHSTKPLTTVYGGLIGLKKLNKDFAKLAEPHIEDVKSRIEHFGTHPVNAAQMAAVRIRKFFAEEGI